MADGYNATAVQAEGGTSETQHSVFGASWNRFQTRGDTPDVLALERNTRSAPWQLLQIQPEKAPEATRPEVSRRNSTV